MQYMLMLFADPSGWTSMTKEQQLEAVVPYAAFMEALKKSGAFRHGNRLQPSAAATTVRVMEGKSQVLDGPYIDSKEQLGGYFVIEAPDLDAAIAWAARCPGAQHGVVEVRPLWPES